MTTEFINPCGFGFSPSASGQDNTRALQAAADQGGTIRIERPGIYKMAGTVYLTSHTRLVFGAGVFLQKVKEPDVFTHLLLNRGALTKTRDRNIAVEGLHLLVNGVDQRSSEVFGLRGQVAFFYVDDLRISGFRCLDLEASQFAIHVCTFSDLLIEDVIIEGLKDGVHLGRGRRFTIRDCVLKTADDAIALNAHDYATSNPELGWLEDGLVENIHDLPHPRATGFFCRLLAGAWSDWRPGMQVQQSDSVVSQGRLYRVQAEPDGTTYTSNTPPTHNQGNQVLDQINWGMVQSEAVYSAGVRNVAFRNISLETPRVGFSIHFDQDRHSRSYYPAAALPVQGGLSFDNIRVKFPEERPLLSIKTPVAAITIANSFLGGGGIHFNPVADLPDSGRTSLALLGCAFTVPGNLDLVINRVPGKRISLATVGSHFSHDDFAARVEAGQGSIDCRSDLPGLLDK